MQQPSCPFRSDNQCLSSCPFYIGKPPLYVCYLAETCKRISSFPLLKEDNEIGENIAKILQNTNIMCRNFEDLEHE